METLEGLNELIKKRLIDRKGDVKLSDNNDIVLYGRALGISENQLLFKILDISETIDWVEIEKFKRDEATFNATNQISNTLINSTNNTLRCGYCNALNEKGVANFCVECGKGLIEKTVSPISTNASSINNNKNKLVSLLVIITLIIIAIAVYFLLFNTHDKVFNDDLNETISDSITIENGYDTISPPDTIYETKNSENIELITSDIALNVMNQYYTDLNSNNFDAENYFSNNVIQFINAKNITPSYINKLFNENNEFLEGKSTIINNELSFERTENDISYYSFWIDYSCFRNKKNKYQYCKVNIEVGFDYNQDIKFYKEITIKDLRFEEIIQINDELN